VIKYMKKKVTKIVQLIINLKKEKRIM